MRGALEDDPEDGVIGDLAAEGVEGRKNLIAFCLTGPGSDQNCVRHLREHEGVGVYGGGAVDDDEAEVIAPRGEQACHACGGDEFGRTGRASAGVHDGEQRKSCDGLGERQVGGAGQHFGQAGVGRGAGGGGGAQIGVDKEHRRAMLGEHGSEAEGQGRCPVVENCAGWEWSGVEPVMVMIWGARPLWESRSEARRHCSASTKGDSCMGSSRSESALACSVSKECGRIGHAAAVPRLGQVVFRHSGEDRRVEESFEVGGSADRGVGEFARDGGRTSDDGSSGERQRGEPGQAGSGGVVRRRTERGTDDGEVAGVQTFKDAGLLETAQQAGVESAALVGLLTGEPQSDGGAGEPGGQVLLLL